MRSQSELKERIILLLIEEINKVGFENLKAEPENVLPHFIEVTAANLTELCFDEITFRRKY